MIITSSKKLNNNRAEVLMSTLPKDMFKKPYINDLRHAIEIKSKLDDVMRDESIDEILASLIPPMELGQYKILLENGVPKAAITWAFFDSRTRQNWLVSRQLPETAKWNNGKEIWGIDCFAEKGYGNRVFFWLINHLRKSGHRGKYMNFIRANSAKKTLRQTRILL